MIHPLVVLYLLFGQQDTHRPGAGVDPFRPKLATDPGCPPPPNGIPKSRI